MHFIAFPERKDSIFQSVSNINEDIEVESSGSRGIFYENKCHLTYPNETLNVNKKIDWCSNVAKSSDEKPWIQFSLKNKAMKLTGYSVRNGCCLRRCCCIDDTTFVDTEWCCCKLYSFSLHGSNDNKTWEIIHKVEKEEKFYHCCFKTYEFSKTKLFKYVRFVNDEEYPGCSLCLQLNQIDFYGETTQSQFIDVEFDENEESVSIIGKLKRNNE